MHADLLNRALVNNVSCRPILEFFRIGMTVISSWKTEIVMKDGVETKTETAATETYLSEKPSTSATVLPEPTSWLSSSKKGQHVDPLEKDPKRMKRWFD